MKPFDVYPLIDVTPVKASGSTIWDDQGNEYLDLYGGHAVISIGHSHPHYTKRIKEQLDNIAFYSNSVQIPIQKELATKLGQLSGYPDYDLFLCNSGAEANENALKLASFETGKKGFIAFTKGFHGRTSGAVALTDNPKIIAPFNAHEGVHILPFNDLEAVEKQLATGTIAGVIVEGIQGVGGIQVPDPAFLLGLSALTKQYGAKLILDEVQSGYARSGKFFAHQWVEGLKPDLITVAKGMGNGFPIGGVLISPEFKASHGLLGTTFGGNHLACAAALAVLEVIDEENLITAAAENGKAIMAALEKVAGVTEVRGKGLMIGFDLATEAGPVRAALIHEHKIFTGSAGGKHTIRLLPPLNIEPKALTLFLEKLETVLNVKQST
ncbi:aspartate aminotransferase family protein [Echinicola vietnamensis]|uniref:Ornithine/acetylornithine aminotransferase n=1 Tax=Echinicola vietnamensis (strain DSM 17526 / LMG 23754 / KMM 6221) TaxID=926556 RepID=L0G5F2_ECHVK|nr:aminotransferase class III-fold pyridoxal phosphate-dependent enzyme [Echinicola vietnamensis]AGA80060.1 ornithine/acetylornithine aminotransferase [Echinicola vietnamensis DSM 17526]